MPCARRARQDSNKPTQASRQRPTAQRRRSLFGLLALALLFAAPSTDAQQPVTAAAAVKASSAVTSQDTANRPPVISAPGDQSFAQGETIQRIAIQASDPDDDSLKLSVSGLPSGLSYASGQVGGTVAADAAAQDYTVTITADDGVNPAVSASFTITVTAANRPPVISAPGDQSFAQGETIQRIAIQASDPDDDSLKVSVSGLPSGLSYASGRVEGTVAADAAAQDYTVTITADDGVNPAVSASFTITVTAANRPPVISAPGDQSFARGETIQAIAIQASDPDDDSLKVSVSGLPPGLSYASGQVGGTVAADAAAQDYTVTITADDGVNPAVSASFTITVTAANRPPVISAPGDQSFARGETIQAIAIQASDPDDDSLKVSVSGLPPGLSYASGRVEGTVAADAAAQDYTVTITADDGVNPAVSASFTITVTAANRPPVISAPGDQSFARGETIQAIAIQASDPDDDSLKVSVSGLPSGLSYASGQVGGTVAADAAAQDYTVTITADDGVNPAVSASFTITVTAANRPPVISAPGDQSFARGETIQAIAIQASDPDDDSLKVSVSGLPSGLSYASGQVGGTVAADAAAQDYTVTITADDGVNPAVSASFTITVTAANRPPVISAPGDQSFARGETIQAIAIQASDPDDDSLKVSVSGLPPGLSYASGRVEGTVAADAAAQDYTVTITADDGVNPAVSASFTITVTAANRPPVISAPGDQSFARGETIQAIAIQASDPDDDSLKVSLSGLPSGLSYASGRVEGTVAADAAAQDYAVSISADDGVNPAVSASFTITVTAANRPPVISAPGDQSFAQGETIQAIAIQASDPDDDSLKVSVSGLPSGLSYASGQVGGTVAADAAAQDYTVTITADDGVNTAVIETFTITVTAAGNIPDDGGGATSVTLSANPSSVSEDAGATSVTVTATADAAVASATDVTVSVGGSGTAASGTDYTAVGDFTITIAANAASGTGTFTLTPAQDTAVEGDETIGVAGSAAGLTVSGTTLTLTDDDRAAPSVTLSVNPSSVSENAGATSVTVTATASSAVAANTAVTVSIGGGSATSGTDYEAVADLELEIPAGGTTGRGAFKLTPIDDTEGEGDETISVSGIASGLSVNGTSLTLTDYEEASAEWWFGARLSVSPGSVSENGGSQKVTVTAEVSEWGTSNSDISYEVTVGKGGDSAASGTDYKAVSKFRINIKSGRRSGSNSFNLEPIGDTAWEGDETITIHASGTGGAQSTTLTLTDEGDRPYGGPPITLSANPSKVSEADGATTVTVTATLPSAASADEQATLSVGGGTATPGTDYAAVSDFTITVAKNATTATSTFTLTPTQDTLAEGDETITITGAAGVSTPATLTLTDDDTAPDVTLSASPSSVTEHGGAKTVTVTATSAAAAAKARTVLVAVGNRQDTATPGTDYTVVPAFNITIAANATSATGTFTLTPTNDTSVEDAESISIDGTPESAGAAFTVDGTAMTLTDDDAMPAVTLSATPSSVDEAALATPVTVKATAASTVAWARAVTVSVGKTGSAASGTDYAAVSDFTITIAANATSGTGTFTLTPTQDTTNEGNETIGVAGTSLNTTVTGTTVTIADDDINPAVTLSAAPSKVSEGASATSVTVTATAASSITSARTVTVSVGDSGTATSGTDYAAVSDFTITIAANATSGTGTFTLTPTQDTQLEGGETIGVDGSSPNTTVTGTTVALTDDESLPPVTLSVSTSSVSEGASATSVTVTATAAASIASARTVTVSVGQTGTASPGSDYAAVTDFDITIASNATSGTGSFTLTPTQDTVVEYNETIGVDGSSPNTTMTNATITLTDDDKDAVTLSLNRRSLGEEASGTSVTVTATAATAIAVARTVTVSVGDSGTATSGTDYAAVSDFTITIAANATSGTGSFTLTPTQDTTNEGNETIGVAGTNSLSTVTGTTLTLVDDDQDTISLSSTKTGISETWSGSVSVTATRPSATTSAVAVTIIVGADTDSATEGVDYQKVDDFTITIPANQTSASGSFTLTGIRDAVADNNELLSISGLATGYKVSGVSNGISIFEWFSTIELKADVSSVSESDGATTVTVTANIHPTVFGTTPVDVSVGGGTATSGTDYAAVSNFRINIPNKAESATGTFTLTPTQDSLLEGEETININGHGSHFTTYGGKGTSIKLTDAQTVALSAHPSSVSEGAPPTQVAVTATATGTVSTPRTLTVSVGDTGTATSGTDYAAVSDFDITIPANKTGATNTFTLTPTKDSAGEGDETIGVSGSSTGAYVHDTTLTLTDTNPAVTLTASPSSISEGGSATAVTVTATASSALATARTVTVSVGASGTATSGTDYAAVSDFTITIAANETSGTGSFTLTPTDDTALEGDETIDVTGASAEAATISRAVLTLTDDDLPTIALTTVPSYVAVAEGAGLKSVTVRATAAAAMKAETTVTLSVGAGGDSATKTTDYTTSNVQTITIPKGQSTAEASFELTPVQDTAVEGNESVSVSGTSSGGHTVTGTALTLTDDDKHAISLSASPSSVGEGASATSVTVTATAKSATSAARTVTVKVGGSGTATSGTDYAAVSDFTVTIAANATSGTGTFTLTPTQDTAVEGSETIGVAGSSTNSTVTGTTVTLTDDDSYPAITLSANPSSVGEGALGTSTTVTVTATAASAISSARTVTVSVGGSGTATAGTDYATVADFTVTIAANATSGTGTFTLTPTQDTAVEGNETVGVDGSSASSTVTGTTVTITDDDTHAITLSASPSSVSESKASETITVTATINVARTSATAVTVSVGESGDEATSGTDYKAVSDFTVTIAANATSGTGTFTFEPKTDTAHEGFESVTISGTTAQSGGGANAQSASTSIPVTNTSLSIHDSSNYPAVTLSAAPSSVGESDGATSVTVTATAASAIASSREVTVSVGGSGTATSGTDYSAVSDFIIKIAADATSGTGTFTLTPTGDSVVEGSETIGVSGTSLSTTVTPTTVTLTDDDSAEVTINDANAAEGSSMTFTVTLDTAVAGGLTVTPDFTDVTATEGTDYDENTAALSFTGNAGETQTFTVSTTQDTVVEGDETFTVGLSVSNAPSGVTVTATDTGTGTINSGSENEVDTTTLTIDDAGADEGDSMTFTVTLSEAVQGGLTVTPGYTHGTASKGDYSTNTNGLTFSGTKGETQTFTVSTTEDAVLEANETFTVGLTVSGTTLSDRITSSDTGTGTINNDDGAAVTINDANADEGDSMTFTVTLDKAVQGGLTVTPGYTNGTASSSDYTANTTALSFSGTANETKTFTVATTEDAQLEANETFTVGLSVSDTSLSVSASDTGTGTINNDDGATVTINDVNADEGASMTFTVTLGAAVQGGLTVTPSFTDGTATEGTDYDENTTALSFSGTANETKTFTVSTTEDAVLEANETFTVSLSVSNAPSGVTASDTGTGTINNDDSAAVTINDANADEGNSMTFTVTLDKAVQGGLTVTPGFTDGTATEGTDYDENTTALSFSGTANETKTFTVSTTEDDVFEGNETFTVDLSVSGTSLDITSSDTGTGTINNDDGATVTVNNANADEGASMTFTVTLGAAVQGGLTVTPGYTNGTAASADYTANTTALSFSGTKGETKTFTVSTTEDAVLEANETFTVGLTVSDTSLDITSTDTGTGTINNDDSAEVTINDANADEGNSMTFTVTLDKAVQGGLTVTPGYSNKTASSGDYTANTTALSFSGTANETKTFTVATTEDAVLETNETFTVSLSVSNAPSGVTASDTGAGTINNDDSAAVTINDASADEGDGMTFTVTLSEAVEGGLTVTPGYTNGTASSTDYTKNTTALSFSGTKGEARTFTVATAEDAVLEGNETFTVSLSVSNAPSGVTASDTGAGTINNDDGATVTVNNANADEGDSMTFTVTLGAAVQGGLTVTPGYTDGTASSSDYNENTTALSFSGTANETKTFTVSTIEDNVLEGNETFTVDLSVSGTSLSITSSDTGTGTINNDDSAAVTINDANADEGDSMTFTVTLGAVVQGGLTVTPGYTNGSASSTDYTAHTSALTFAGTSGETQTFTVATIEDTFVETDETFTVRLAVSGTSAPVNASDTATGTIIDDDGRSEYGSATVTIADASADEGDSISFTVTLDKAVTGGLTVTPGFADGTATEGSDYTPNTAALTFTGATGETQTFTVATIEDTFVEADETFTVSLAVSATTANVIASDTATGTILDDDGVAVTIADASADEGDSISFTVTLDKAVTGGLTVTPDFTDGTATEGSDYTPNTAALTFAGTAGETQTFTVATIEDKVAEDDETFTVGLSVSGATANVIAADTATGTIIDDDGSSQYGSATVTIADASADEGDSISFTVTLDKAVTGGLTVTPDFTDGTATEGSDYTPNTAALTFAGTAGETQTFTVATIEDKVAEDDETFTVSLAVSATSASVTASDTATGTILDDDGAIESGTEGNNAPQAVDDYITVSQGGTATTLANGSSTASKDLPRDPPGPSEELFDDLDGAGDEPIQSGLILHTSVLANDRDLEDDISQLSAELVDSPAHGDLTLNRDGTFTYTHDGGEAAEDRFTYRAKDSDDNLSEPATVTITIMEVNAAPEAERIPDQTLIMGRNKTLNLEDYFSDPDENPLSYEALASDAGGTVRVNVSGSSLVLIPVAVNATRVTVTARDTAGLSVEQTFGVTVKSDPSRNERLLELSLAVFGRTVASQAVDAIGGRFGSSSREPRASVGGQGLDFAAASDEQGRTEGFLQAVGSMLAGQGCHPGSHALAGTAAGPSLAGQSGAAGWPGSMQTGFSPGGGTAGFSSAGGFSVGGMAGLNGAGGLSGGACRAGVNGAGGFQAGSLGSAAGQSGGLSGHSGFGPRAGRDLMTGSSFQLALGQDGPAGGSGEQAAQEGGWMLWGQGVRSDFAGRPQSDLGLDGRVGAAYVGLDHRWGSKALVGVAASHSVGSLDYSNGGGAANELEVGARLTSVLPYALWSPRQGLDLWGLMGIGRGAADLEVDGGPVEMGIDMRMAALGMRNELTRVGAVDLALKADAFTVSIGSEAVEGVRAVNGGARRARLMLEGSTDWRLSPNTKLTPRVEMGARLDGGDADTGLGTEVGGGASLFNQRLGLEVEARGHWLLAHQSRNFKERGASLAVRLDPGSDRKGLGFSFAPLWGNSGGGADALWRSEQMMASHYHGDRSEAMSLRPNRAQAILSYGLPTLKGRGRLIPFTKMDLEDTSFPRLGGGLRFDLLSAPDAPASMQSDGLQLELFGDYRRRQDLAAGPFAAQGAGPAGSAAGRMDYRIGVALVLVH